IGFRPLKGRSSKREAASGSDAGGIVEFFEHQFLAAEGIGQVVGSHDHKGWGINVQRDQVLAPSLKVGNLVDIGVLAADRDAGGNVAREYRLDVPVGRKFEECFSHHAVEYAHGTTRTPVIVNRRALPVFPTQD